MFNDSELADLNAFLNSTAGLPVAIEALNVKLREHFAQDVTGEVPEEAPVEEAAPEVAPEVTPEPAPVEEAAPAEEVAPEAEVAA